MSLISRIRNIAVTQIGTPIVRRNFSTFLEKWNVALWDLHIQDAPLFFQELTRWVLEHGGITARLWELYARGDWKYSRGLDDFFYKLTSSPEAMEYVNNHIANRFFDWQKRITERTPEIVWEAHYDIPVEMYRWKLGETMKYTAPEWNKSLGAFDLDTHQRLWMDMICQRAELEDFGAEKKKMKVLEIGFWYGTLADHAIRNYGVHVTGLTVSDWQMAFAKDYMKHNGTLEQASLRNLDWKKLYTDSRYRAMFEEEFQWKFDRIISIEMIEAVSTEDLPLFFQFLSSCLNGDGILFLQAINSDRFVHTTDGFIDKYIFPDGVVPEDLHIMTCAERAGFQQESSANDIATQAYDRALMAWYENLAKIYPDLASQLGDYYNKRRVHPFPYRNHPSFLRIFEYYLKSCAGSFRSGYNRDGQYKFYKNPQNKVQQIIPATREQMNSILKTKQWGELPKAA